MTTVERRELWTSRLFAGAVICAAVYLSARAFIPFAILMIGGQANV